MKKYFLYTYFLSVSLVIFLLYKNYQNNITQHQLVIDSEIYHDYEIAKEFLNSKFKNIYYKNFNDFITRKTINNINSGNNDAKELLKNATYKSYYPYKDFLEDVAFYNLEGELLLSLNNTQNQKLQIQRVQNLIDQQQLGFEYIDDNTMGFVKIDPIIYQGQTIAYVKQMVLVDTFIKSFLPNYFYTIVHSKYSEILSKSFISLEAFNHDNYFVLELFKRYTQNNDFLNSFYTNSFLSILVLSILLFILYRGLQKEKDLKDKIEKQKEFFKKIINKSPNPIFVKDKNNRYLLANSATTKLFGFDSSDHMIGKTNEELLIPQKIATSLANDENRAFKTKEVSYKYILKVQNSFYKFVHVPIDNLRYPICEEMILGFATNITSEVEKKNQLAKLNTQLKFDVLDQMASRFKINEKFKKIFDNIHDAMFVCSLGVDGVLNDFIDINASGRIFLNRFSQYKGKKPNEIFKGFIFEYNEKRENFQTQKYSYILKIPNGSSNINFQVSCSIIYINKQYHAVIFVQHIDDIIKLKKEKKEKQVLLENIFKKAKSAIVVIDINGNILRANKSFYETLGVGVDYFIEKTFFDLFRLKDKESMINEHAKMFENSIEMTHEYHLKVLDNSVEVIGSSTIIENSTEQKFRLFIFEDITKQKRLEKEQFQNSRIIAQQAKMAEMGEMIGAIAHQWRQPLNAINAAAMKLNFSATLDTISSDEIVEKTKFIEQQSLKMSETINDFMNFFKPSKNKEQFTLLGIYTKIFDFLESQLKNRDIVMSLEDPDQVKIFGYQNEFEHILLNLINNAKDAYEDFDEQKIKTIKIVASQTDEMVTITVSDNAGGIPEDILNKVFNPYFTTKEEGKGTGIGLYMTKTIIDKHFKGDIKVTNGEDGAVFTLEIPRVKND